MTPLDPRTQTGWPARMRSFLAIYLACALIFQLGGATPPWGPTSPLEAFCAGLFGMLALAAVQIAVSRAGLRKAFWLASSAALLALGLDEFLEVHETIDVAWAGEGDLLKVALWGGAGGALAFVHWLERPTRGAQLAMGIGYAFHTLYLVAETGDGGMFQLPASVAGLATAAEDPLELMMLSAYLFCFGEIASERSAEQPQSLDGPAKSDGRQAA